MMRTLLSRSLERRVIINFSSFNADTQKFWFQIIAVASSLVDIPVCIELDRTHLSTAAYLALQQLSKEVKQLTYRFVDRIKQPLSKQSFAFIASTDVFSHKLLAGNLYLYVEVHSDAGKIDPILLRYGKLIGIFDDSIKKYDVHIGKE